MKLFQKLIAAPAVISVASGFAVNATEINNSDLSYYSNSNNLVSLGDFKSDTLYPGDWAYDSLKDLTNSPKFSGNSVSRLEAAVEFNNLIAGGEGLINGAAIDRLSDELGSELAIMKGRVDGLEARVNGIEAGTFSETTTMKGKVEMQIGVGDSDAGAGVNNTENATTFAYHYEVDLNTSFTGDDKLNVEIATGNSSGTNTTQGITGFGESQPGDMLAVEDVNYTFPLGRWDVSIGDSMDLSKNFPNACQLGTIVDAMDDCGAKNAVDAGGDVSASFGTEFGDGWEFGFGFTGDSGTKGIGTKQSTDGYGLALGYSNDTYGVTFGYALKETSETAETTYVGATAYYSPENLGTFSGGYELGDKSGTDDDTTQYKVGYATDLGEGTLEVGFGTNGAIADNVDEEFAYEASYSFPINDGVSMTAFGYIAEVADKDDTTGIGLTTTFKF